MTRALIVAAPGSLLAPEASRPVYAAVSAIRATGAFTEVRPAFWQGEPQLSRALDGLASNDITIVPFSVGGESFVDEIIPREMRLDGRVTLDYGKVIRLTRPLGAQAEGADTGEISRLVDLILELAEEAARW